MNVNSATECTDATWNPVTGCTKISRGCDRCYAERFAERWRAGPGRGYEQGFDLRLWPNRLDQPSRWRKPRKIFVNSMSDLFHKDIERGFLDRIFDTMEQADWHRYQILTKRNSAMRDYLRARYADRRAPDHIWCSVTVEDQRAAQRIEHLRDAPAGGRFRAPEPLLGPLDALDLSGISWVIARGESGPGARPLKKAWILPIRDRGVRFGVPFFFKQWGVRTPKAGGRELDGRVHDGMPGF